MIRRIRMTVAQLKKYMDNRFNTTERRLKRRFAGVDARFDRTDARVATRFDSLDAKFDALFRLLKDKQDHHTRIVDNHEDRLKDLERATGRQGA
jgi:hypothetical protein